MPTRREFLNYTVALSALGVGTTRMAQALEQTTPAVKYSMNTYRIPQTDLTVSRVAYGTALIDFDPKGPDFKSVLKPAIRTAYENGITFFDSADIYGQGLSETSLGEVLKESPGLRHRIIIQSKCGLRMPEGWVLGEPVPDGIEVDLSGEHILSAVEGSLQRLGTDHLDVLLLHAPDPLVRPEEVAQAFDMLHRGGKVRYFGVSSYRVGQIDLLRKYLTQPLVVSQIPLGLANDAALAATDGGLGGVVDYCRLHDMQVQAFSPLRGGLLKAPADASPPLKEVAQMLVELATKKNTNPSAVALAWLLHHPAGIVPIIGSVKAQYIVENCAADRVELSDTEWHQLFHLAGGIQPRQGA